MKLHVFILIAILAMSAPTQALLGAKLALFGVLRNSLGGGGSLGGYGNSGGYGGGSGSGYGSGYGGGYGGGYNRPVYTGQSSNHGWGQQSYGGSYNSGFHGGYNNGYNGGNEEAVRVIKVIVNHEQPQGYYDNYARNSAASGSAISATSGASWTPVSATTYAAQPVPLPAPVQAIQPAPRPVYIESQQQPQYIQRPQSVYQQLPVQRPIQYSVQQPSYQQGQPAYQQTIRLIVDGDSQRGPAQSYGPPPPAVTYVAPSADNAGAYNSDSWSISHSANGLNNVGTGPFKNGGVTESVGC